MITLFKTRTFGELLTDTFAFFRQNGRHYFRNYFTINGGLLLVLMVLLYFIMKVYFEVLFFGIGRPGSNPNFIVDYFQDNLAMVVTGFVVFILLAMLITMMHYAFPVVYLQLYEKNNGPNFTTADLLKALRTKIGKVIVFFLASLVVFLPLMLITFGIAFLLVFILIGIPVLLIAFPAFTSWVSLSFYDYLDDDKSFLDALGSAFGYLKSKFWVIVGCTLLMYVMLQIVMTITTMIPYMIGIFSMFTDLESGNGNLQQGNMQFFSVMMVVVMEISIALNYILGNLLQLNQGLAYYSCREAAENRSSQSQIDSIGNSFE